jgi:hypothetical protein
MSDERTDDLAPREVLDQWTVPEMPSDLKERVMMQIDQPWNEASRPVDASLVRRANAALVVFATAAAAAALVLVLREPTETMERISPPPAEASMMIVAGDGELEKEQIQTVVRSHLDAIQACYEAGLARNAKLAGKVVLALTIGGTGAVTESSVHESTLADPHVGTCMANAAKGWTFPPPGGGGSVSVLYPFQLEAG